MVPSEEYVDHLQPVRSWLICWERGWVDLTNTRKNPETCAKVLNELLAFMFFCARPGAVRVLVPAFPLPPSLAVCVIVHIVLFLEQVSPFATPTLTDQQFTVIFVALPGNLAEETKPWHLAYVHVPQLWL